MTDLTLKRAEAAEQCINRIQDFLEYQYRGLGSVEGLRNVVMVMIDQYADEMRGEPLSDMALQAKDFDKLRNAVGARPDVRRNNWGYRNRYSSPHQCSSISRLVDAGFMAVIGSSNDMVYCKVTEAGCDAIGLTQEQKQRALEDD